MKNPRIVIGILLICVPIIEIGLRFMGKHIFDAMISITCLLLGIWVIVYGKDE